MASLWRCSSVHPMSRSFRFSARLAEYLQYSWHIRGYKTGRIFERFRGTVAAIHKMDFENRHRPTGSKGESEIVGFFHLCHDDATKASCMLLNRASAFFFECFSQMGQGALPG